MAVDLFSDTSLAAASNEVLTRLQAALAQYGMVQHPAFGKIWAYEVDGYGNALMMDDANAPSLLSLPYLGSCDSNDPTYQRTRRFAQSTDNPYFFKGKAAEGIGGPHIGLNSIWPLSLIMRALISNDDREILQCLQWLRDTTAGTGFMHESFNQDDPSKFTRAWFAWANTLFGELLLKLADQKPSLLKQRYGNS
jgi:meiotically up-regulated gene 157 (Mug157) protein